MQTKLSTLSAAIDLTLVARYDQLLKENSNLKTRNSQLIEELRRARSADQSGYRRVIRALRLRDASADEHF